MTYLYGKCRNFKNLECCTTKSKQLVFPDFALLYCLVSIMNMHKSCNKKVKKGILSREKLGEQHIEEA